MSLEKLRARGVIIATQIKKVRQDHRWKSTKLKRCSIGRNGRSVPTYPTNFPFLVLVIVPTYPTRILPLPLPHPHWPPPPKHPPKESYKFSIKHWSRTKKKKDPEFCSRIKRVLVEGKSLLNPDFAWSRGGESERGFFFFLIGRKLIYTQSIVFFFS